MTDTVVLIIGVFVFALTVSGTVMAGSFTLSRRIEAEEDLGRSERVVEG
jgi:hypothetical protein